MGTADRCIHLIHPFLGSIHRLGQTSIFYPAQHRLCVTQTNIWRVYHGGNWTQAPDSDLSLAPAGQWDGRLFITAQQPSGGGRAVGCVGLDPSMVAVGGSGRCYSGHSDHHHRFLEDLAPRNCKQSGHCCYLPRSRPPSVQGPRPLGTSPPKKTLPKPKRSRTIPARFDPDEAPTCICHQPDGTALPR